jgi:hypothetical protein
VQFLEIFCFNDRKPNWPDAKNKSKEYKINTLGQALNDLQFANFAPTELSFQCEKSL